MAKSRRKRIMALRTVTILWKMGADVASSCTVEGERNLERSDHTLPRSRDRRAAGWKWVVRDYPKGTRSYTYPVGRVLHQEVQGLQPEIQWACGECAAIGEDIQGPCEESLHNPQGAYRQRGCKKTVDGQRSMRGLLCGWFASRTRAKCTR